MRRTGWRVQRGMIATLIAAVLGVAVAQCGESKTGPTDAVAIEFNGGELPSLVLGDSLRDTLGNLDSLRALIFNSSGDTIHGGTIRYVRADTTHVVKIDSISGKVTTIDTGAARVVAQAGALQSPPETLFVVERPDNLASATSTDTALEFTPIRSDTTLALTVLLGSAGFPVDHYRVEYAFVYPADLQTPDSTRVLLTDENKKVSYVDTTGASAVTTVTSGVATRYIRITPNALSGFNDSVVVEARAFLPNHTPVPGSPIRFKVMVKIN